MKNSNQNHTKNTIWIYAVVLFTSAFIVLLLTAISQIKLDNNIKNFQNQINSTENEKAGFQMSLMEALEENKKLKEENADLKNKIEDYEQQYNDVQEVKNNPEKSEFANAYELLLKAEEEYNNKNPKACAKLLKDVKPNLLGNKALEKYNYLKNKTFKLSAVSYYYDGMVQYKNKVFAEASNRFRISFELDQDGEYSDSCCFYLADSEYKLGNKEEAIRLLNVFMEKYQKSKLYDKAVTLKEKIQLENQNTVPQ